MKNIFKNKRNILIMMFALVVIMGIGFAAYSQQLQIKDTSSIDSDWNVYIKEVSVESKSDSASGNGIVDETSRLKADLTTDLKYPGDNIIYNITVANDGNIDAILEKINFSMEKEDTVIKYYYSVDDETTWNEVTKNGENPYNVDLLSNTTDEFQVKVEYDPTKTGTAAPEQKSNKLTLNFDYVQKGTGTGTYIPGGNSDKLVVYRWGTDTVNVGDSLESISGTTKDYNTLGKNIFLKHIINKNIVESTEACVIVDGNLSCWKPNNFEYYYNGNDLPDNMNWDYRGGHLMGDIKGITVDIMDGGRVLVQEYRPISYCIVDSDGESSYCINQSEVG